MRAYEVKKFTNKSLFEFKKKQNQTLTIVFLKNYLLIFQENCTK